MTDFIHSGAGADPDAAAGPNGDRPAGAVELRAVTKRFDDSTVVDGLDLAIRPGEFISLLGPSGCGKTTTLRMIGGFEQPTTGTVYLNGVDVTNTPPNRRNVNTVFQSYALFPHLTVAGNVGYPLRLRRRSKSEIQRRVGESLEMVQLSGLGERHPAQLSGGQRQRVALARAIVAGPDVLLLDEPLSALDLKLRQAMRTELRRLHRQIGITFVFVTHDQGEALTMSDRVAVMDKGRLLQVGAPEEVYEQPTTRFVAEFIGDANLLTVDIERIAGTMAWVRHNGTTLQAPIAGDPTTSDAATTSGTLSVRPHRVEISAVGTDGAAEGLAGVLTELTFNGDATSAGVTLADGSVITATRHNGHDVRPFGDLRPGDAAAVTWPAGAARVFTA